MNFGPLPERRVPETCPGHTKIGKQLSKTVGAEGRRGGFGTRAAERLIMKFPAQTVYPRNTSSKVAAMGDSTAPGAGVHC